MTNLNYQIIASSDSWIISNPITGNNIILDWILCVNESWNNLQSGAIFATVNWGSISFPINSQMKLWIKNNSSTEILNNSTEKIICSTSSYTSSDVWGKYSENKYLEFSQITIYIIAIFAMISLYLSPYLLILYFYKKRNITKNSNSNNQKNEK